MSVPPCVAKIVSPLQTIRSLLPLPGTKFIAGWRATVIIPDSESWTAGSLQPKALFTVLMVKLNAVSTAKPATVGDPKIVTVFIAVWTVVGPATANTASLIPGSVSVIVKEFPFLEVILSVSPPIITGSTWRSAFMIRVLSPFKMSKISLSFWGAPVFTV